MKHVLIALISLTGILWFSGAVLNFGIGQAQSLQLAAAQSQKDTPGYADVAPIFNQRCIMCHSGPQPPMNLRLDSYSNIMAGSHNGPVVVSENSEGSELVRRVRGTSIPRMPLTGPPWLSDREIDLIERWIAGGASEDNKGDTAQNTAIAVPPQAEEKDQPITYTRVAPILGKRCVKCHMVNGLMGPPPEGLHLDSYAAILDVRDRARIIPGVPDASELMRRIRGLSLPRMPMDGPPYLDEAEIELIADWIEQGARDANSIKAALPVGAKVRLGGRLTDQWSLDGFPLVVDGSTRLKKTPSVGSYVGVRGMVQSDGSIRVTRIRSR